MKTRNIILGFLFTIIPILCNAQKNIDMNINYDKNQKIIFVEISNLTDKTIYYVNAKDMGDNRSQLWINAINSAGKSIYNYPYGFFPDNQPRDKRLLVIMPHQTLKYKYELKKMGFDLQDTRKIEVNIIFPYFINNTTKDYSIIKSFDN